ncbi:MAG: cellulase family glycosylhydrolase [Proteobacteria bacterium]|nr:cellulase family glycosylhydrolase [Pseudomonadota bacterium]
MKFLAKGIAIATVLAASHSFAAMMTNNISGLYDETLLPQAQQPLLCVKDSDGKFTEWKHGEKFDPNAISGNKYYFGASLRLGGCADSDIYLGWLDVSGSDVKYKPADNSHIQLTDYSITNNVFNGKVAFTKILPAGSSFPTNTRVTDDWYTGINLSGLEFSTMPNASVIPDLSDDGADNKPTIEFLNQGANTIRVPVRWAYLQPYGYQDINSSNNQTAFQDYLVAPTLATITSHKYYAIVDLHSYMHYGTIGSEVAGCTGQGQCPQGSLVTDPKYYVNIWNKLYSAIKQDPAINEQYLMFDLVNEPSAASGESLTAQQAFDMEVAVIKSLTGMGFKGKLLVEGVHFSGLHSWDAAGNAIVFTRQNFLNAGVSSEVLDNQVIINVHQYLDSDFSGTHDQCLQDITTTGDNGFNLDAFVSYLKANKFKAIVTEFGVGKDQASCAKPLGDFLAYMKSHAYTETNGYGFVGWTAWSTGHGWGDYNLNITPNDWEDNVIKEYFVK